MEHTKANEVANLVQKHFGSALHAESAKTVVVDLTQSFVSNKRLAEKSSAELEKMDEAIQMCNRISIFFDELSDVL